jgi:hypothetical protein
MRPLFNRCPSLINLNISLSLSKNSDDGSSSLLVHLCTFGLDIIVLWKLSITTKKKHRKKTLITAVRLMHVVNISPILASRVTNPHNLSLLTFCAVVAKFCFRVLTRNIAEPKK